MSCSPAPLCRQALLDATASFPSRSRSSDGICGDPAHQARVSDHNSGNAFDLTQDAGSGCDAHRFAEQVKREAPSWVKYVISKGRIWNPSVSPNWRTYTGSNPHVAHAHFSINSAYRNTIVVFPWSNGGAQTPDEEAELMAAKDEINAHTTAAVNAAMNHIDARQTDDCLAIYGQLHRFEVNAEGDLRHQWYTPGDGWNAGNWARGCVPNSKVSVMADAYRQLHVFAPDAEDPNLLVHAWWGWDKGVLNEERIPR